MERSSSRPEADAVSGNQSRHEPGIVGVGSSGAHFLKAVPEPGSSFSYVPAGLRESPAPSCFDGVLTGLHKLDLAFFVDHESDSIGDSNFLDEHAIGFTHFSVFEIAEEGEAQTELGREFFLGGSVVGADSEHFGVRIGELGHTRLVRQHFLRSATGERGREEGQNDGLLAAKILKRYFAARSGAQSKIGPPCQPTFNVEDIGLAAGGCAQMADEVAASETARIKCFKQASKEDDAYRVT